MLYIYTIYSYILLLRKGAILLRLYVVKMHDVCCHDAENPAIYLKVTVRGILH